MTSTVLTRVVSRLLLAPVLVIAIAIMVRGYADVGDGFSAGVVAALGLLLQYLAFGRAEAERSMPVRAIPSMAFAGLLLALVITAAPLIAGDPPLTHWPAPGAEVRELGTLELTTAIAFDVAVFVLVLGAAFGVIHLIASAGEGDEKR